MNRLVEKTVLYLDNYMWESSRLCSPMLPIPLAANNCYFSCHICVILMYNIKLSFLSYSQMLEFTLLRGFLLHTRERQFGGETKLKSCTLLSVLQHFFHFVCNIHFSIVGSFIYFEAHDEKMQVWCSAAQCN